MQITGTEASVSLTGTVALFGKSLHHCNWRGMFLQTNNSRWHDSNCFNHYIVNTHKLGYETALLERKGILGEYSSSEILWCAWIGIPFLYLDCKTHNCPTSCVWKKSDFSRPARISFSLCSIGSCGGQRAWQLLNHTDTTVLCQMMSQVWYVCHLTEHLPSL